MSGTLKGRTAIITGAGRGLGREHALLFAREGAQVVVNDLGGGPAGEGEAATPAEEVVAEIEAEGGRATANYDDVSSWEGAERLVQQALDAFGEIDILVNNAGIIRDRMLVNMSEQEWDDVIRVHLKGHFCPTRHVAAHWRDRSKAGSDRPRAIVNTASPSGLFGNVGQTNYAAAKAGIATLGMVWSKELRRYGVRVNTVAPVARTRLTLATPGASEALAAPTTDGFDPWDPANVSPLVAYLASDACPFSGFVFYVRGGQVGLMRGYGTNQSFSRSERWTIDDLAATLEPLASERPLADWGEIRVPTEEA